MHQRLDVVLTWEGLLSERLHTRRTRRGWRQVDVAHEMATHGLDWTQPVVAAIEARKRDCGVVELTALASAFRRSVKEFLSPDDDEEGYLFSEAPRPVQMEEVRLEHAPGVHVSLHSFLGTFDGTDRFLFGLSGGPTLLDWTGSEDPMVTKLARVLDVESERVLQLSHRLWGQDPQVERDRRLGDVTDVPPRTVQARRGHVTRTMTAELREELS